MAHGGTCAVFKSPSDTDTYPNVCVLFSCNSYEGNAAMLSTVAFLSVLNLTQSVVNCMAHHKLGL
jgi:hypothetical protein